MKKILLLITNLGKGGAQKVFYDHAIAFSKNFDVTEAVFDINEDERLYNSGLLLSSLSEQEKSKIPGPVGRLLSRAASLKKLVQKQKTELVISHMDGANWVNVLSKSSAKKILVVHGTVLHDHAQKPLIQWVRKKLIIPYLYNKATLTIAVSDGIAAELKEHCSVKNAISIPNFFDIADISKKAQEAIPQQYASLFNNHKVLITSGRLSDQKKQRFLFPVFTATLQQFPDARLVILGDGELRNELIADAQSKGLKMYNVFDQTQAFHNDYDVYFLGYVNNPYQYLSRSTLFLFPSGWEGFPMALCEAMISGVPVLSSDCPTGPRQILAPATFDHAYTLSKAEATHYGYLLPMPDKASFNAAWTNTITELLHDKNTRDRFIEQAQKRMFDFDKPVVMAKWKQVINDVLDK